MKKQKTGNWKKLFSSLLLKGDFLPVMVLWEDMAVKGGWRDDEDVEESAKEPYLVQTIGFLVRINKDRMVLTAGFALDGSYYQEVMQIPCGMIKSVFCLGIRKNVAKKIKKAKSKKRSHCHNQRKRVCRDDNPGRPCLLDGSTSKN